MTKATEERAGFIMVPSLRVQPVTARKARCDTAGWSHCTRSREGRWARLGSLSPLIPAWRDPTHGWGEHSHFNEPSLEALSQAGLEAFLHGGSRVCQADSGY